MKNPSMVSLALLALIIFPAGFRVLVRETGETNERLWIVRRPGFNLSMETR